jgi:hypothetical protein
MQRKGKEIEGNESFRLLKWRLAGNRAYPWPSKSGELELDILSIQKLEKFFPSLDAVFVATKFHVSRWDTGKIDPRLVGQFGMATVDT